MPIVLHPLESVPLVHLEVEMVFCLYEQRGKRVVRINQPDNGNLIVKGKGARFKAHPIIHTGMNTMHKGLTHVCSFLCVTNMVLMSLRFSCDETRNGFINILID